MEKDRYTLLENYMLSCMEDSAHDREHIYRVLYNALEIAKGEDKVDYDVLMGACLLHDVGRKEQYENPKLCHAAVGGEKAWRFLTANGFETEYAEKVKQCIQTHRYREKNEPQSLEAKILFDADKLDTTGAIGIARTLVYKGSMAEPLYTLRPDGTVSDGEKDTVHYFFQEYKWKLEKIYNRFYTVRGREMALERQSAAVRFYEDLYEEVKAPYEKGREELKNRISE